MQIRATSTEYEQIYEDIKNLEKINDFSIEKIKELAIDYQPIASLFLEKDYLRSQLTGPFLLELCETHPRFLEALTNQYDKHLSDLINEIDISHWQKLGEETYPALSIKINIMLQRIKTNINKTEESEESEESEETILNDILEASKKEYINNTIEETVLKIVLNDSLETSEKEYINNMIGEIIRNDYNLIENERNEANLLQAENFAYLHSLYMFDMPSENESNEEEQLTNSLNDNQPKRSRSFSLPSNFFNQPCNVFSKEKSEEIKSANNILKK